MSYVYKTLNERERTISMKVMEMACNVASTCAYVGITSTTSGTSGTKIVWIHNIISCVTIILMHELEPGMHVRMASNCS